MRPRGQLTQGIPVPATDGDGARYTGALPVPRDAARRVRHALELRLSAIRDNAAGGGRNPPPAHTTSHDPRPPSPSPSRGLDEVRAQPVVLDLGDGVGALIVHTGPELLGEEIDISPTGDDG